MWNREVCSVIAAIKHSNLDDLLHDKIKQERLIAERQGRIKESIERKDKHKFETRPGKKEENCYYTPNADRAKPENKTKKHRYTRLPPRNEEENFVLYASVIGTSQNIPGKIFRISRILRVKEKNAPESSETVVTSSREEDKEGNLNYFKEALINGKPIQAYVGQGSKCVLLRRSEAERLNLKYQPIQQNFIIRGYGSGEVKPLGKLKA
ncbi:hypothetical protein QE152_g19787 [Popillia japonica]|uniref:Uncharacterized protein n=1 Tax=Popillia japonica TaxID=7064 RepID=A0AAW1KRP4_POPJA